MPRFALALAEIRERRRRRAFQRHLVPYLAVIATLTVVNLLQSPQHLWVQWVAGCWGIGLAVHALFTFRGNTPQRAWRDGPPPERVAGQG